MEAVHKTYRRPWISEKVNVREFRDQAYRAVSQKWDIVKDIFLSVDERMLHVFQDADELEKLHKECSANLLNCENEEYIEFCRNFEPPEDTDLETLRRQTAEMKKRNESTSYRNMVFQSCRYYYYSSSMEVVTKTRSCNLTDTEFCQVEHPEVILTVQIYRPEMEQVHHQRSGSSRTPTFRVDQQFMVLGSQCLTDVRDMICCQSDAAVVGEFSENPDCSANFRCQEMYRSGFFYISGTFYNDTRDPMNKDYSKTIIEWSESARNVGPFTIAKMEQTRFVDLEIQLGLPYVYQHQGHCEHMIVFSELRLMDSKDSQNVFDYPLVQILQAKKPVHCMSCLLYTARWITTEDSRMPELPYFFCDKCFNAFNYDKKNKKAAEFKSYKYFDKTAIF